MELGRSGRSMMMSAGAGGASAASYGVIATDRKICSTDSGGACSRSRSAAAAAALNDHQKLAALHHDRCPHARARGAANSSELCDRAAPSRPTGSSRRCGCWSTSPFLFSGLLFADSGRRWSSADRAIDDDVGGRRRRERSAATGSSQQIGKSAALTVGALALARAALRRPRH